MQECGSQPDLTTAVPQDCVIAHESAPWSVKLKRRQPVARTHAIKGHALPHKRHISARYGCVDPCYMPAAACVCGAPVLVLRCYLPFWLCPCNTSAERCECECSAAGAARAAGCSESLPQCGMRARYKDKGGEARSTAGAARKNRHTKVKCGWLIACVREWGCGGAAMRGWD